MNEQVRTFPDGSIEVTGRWDDLGLPRPALTPDYLLDQVAAYRDCQVAELHLAHLLSDLETDRTLIAARAVAEGYAAGAIEGKNQGERDRAELLYLLDTDEVRELDAAIADIRGQYELAKAARTATELQLSLLKAYLYSQGGRY